MNATKSKRATPGGAGRLPRSYAALIEMFPPRVARTSEDAHAIAAVLGRMGGRELNHDQADYAALLTRIYADWHAQHLPSRKKTPQSQIVRAMMDEHEMTQAQMADVVGITQGHLSLILKGDRLLSKGSIRRFCDRFKVGVGALL